MKIGWGFLLILDTKEAHFDEERASRILKTFWDANFGTRNLGPEFRDPNFGIRILGPEARSPSPEAQAQKPRSPEAQAQTPKPRRPSPEAQARNRPFHF